VHIACTYTAMWSETIKTPHAWSTCLFGLNSCDVRRPCCTVLPASLASGCWGWRARSALCGYQTCMLKFKACICRFATISKLCQLVNGVQSYLGAKKKLGRSRKTICAMVV
jgi:hypothetical protein